MTIEQIKNEFERRFIPHDEIKVEHGEKILYFSMSDEIDSTVDTRIVKTQRDNLCVVAPAYTAYFDSIQIERHGIEFYLKSELVFEMYFE